MKRISKYFSENYIENLYVLLGISVFTHFIFTIFLSLLIIFELMFKRKYYKKYFLGIGTKISSVIFFLGIIISLYYKNYLGLVGIIIVLCLMIGKYYENEMESEKLKFKMLDITTKFSIIAFFSTLLEVIITKDRGGYWFHLNPNYLGTLMMMSGIGNLYLYFNFKRKNLLFFIINFFTLLLTGSRTGVIGFIFSILFLTYKYVNKRRFCKGIILVLIYVLGVYFKILPFIRSKSIMEYFWLRVDIIKMAFKIFDLRGILLGYGNFHYYKFTNYVYPHSHNVIMELIISYGIIGTIILIIVFFKYLVNKFKEEKNNILKYGILIGVFIHNFGDFTIFWIESIILFIFIFNGGIIDDNKGK